jgi:hypothetical protein
LLTVRKPLEPIGSHALEEEEEVAAGSEDGNGLEFAGAEKKIGLVGLRLLDGMVLKLLCGVGAGRADGFGLWAKTPHMHCASNI